MNCCFKLFLLLVALKEKILFEQSVELTFHPDLSSNASLVSASASFLEGSCGSDGSRVFERLYAEAAGAVAKRDALSAPPPPPSAPLAPPADRSTMMLLS